MVGKITLLVLEMLKTKKSKERETAFVKSNTLKLSSSVFL